MRHPILQIRSVSDEFYEVSDLLVENVSEQRFWLFDLEATGLDTTRERITQIAGIPIEDGRIIDDEAFTMYVALDPEVEIPKVVHRPHEIEPGSRGRIETILRSLDQEEMTALKVDGALVMTCQFCSVDFRFDQAALEAIYAP